MPEPELSCPLRGLTLCDGQEVWHDELRCAVPCYCGELAAAVRQGSAEEASELRYLRARTVARASDTLAGRAAALRLRALAERADAL